MNAGCISLLALALSWNPKWNCILTGSGTHKASYPVGTKGSFLGVKRPEREVDHLHLVPRSRIRGAIRPLLHYAFLAWFSVKAQGQLYIYFYCIWL